MIELGGGGYPAGYSYPATAVWFAAGAAITAIFSGSLAALTPNAELPEVLAVGMLVPSFTWIVQLAAASVGLSGTQRRFYCGDLGRVCVAGSLALLPAAAINIVMPLAPLWLSAANVLLSVALMAVILFRRAAQHGIPPAWPISWCVTIALNIGLFVWASWKWW